MIDNVFSQIIPLTAAMALPFPVIKATRVSSLYVFVGISALSAGIGEMMPRLLDTFFQALV